MFMLKNVRDSIMQRTNRYRRAPFLVIVMLASSLMPFALPTAWAELADDFRIWGNVTARGNFGFIDPDLKRFRWWGEIQPRTREEGEDMDQLLIRPGIGYALTDHSTVWIGYAHVINFVAVGDNIHEDRFWQQYMWSGATPLGGFTSRTRFEQRWQTNGNETGGRFRQMFKLSWPIPVYPAVSLVGWDEVFIHLNDTNWGARQGFDQNRGFAGIGYRVQPPVLIEIGYMNQYINKSTLDNMNHVLSLNLFLDF
ncbi:MAG: hypothetical protein A4E20_11270 [Nitrospira sp. SG-bin2]|jgi:hypothetical protein|uniref:DUF2490 domain-containing protein n=1 Tax=Nitrospira cf. moscoviensis SBR1015 TaxID=96242 RepID=UPI000A0D22E7|nr:DUF2490 domain-containing protein [Nitrospira cf. moscoviensis SBR1015]OQW34380.1 MAG: hypothetical protein A4E20_11270 [Nitrospira sp. SG-bin2]